jgi:hypothetical protein
MKKTFPISKKYGFPASEFGITFGIVMPYEELESVLLKAERAGELIGMRNQHEIEQKAVCGVPSPIGSWISIKDYKKQKERITQLEKELKTALESVEIYKRLSK